MCQPSSSTNLLSLLRFYSPETKGAWVMRFDDVLADALELGPLADKKISFSDDEKERIQALLPDDPCQCCDYSYSIILLILFITCTINALTGKRSHHR